MEFPGFKLLKEAFDRVASKHDAKEYAQKGIRALAAGGQATVDRGLQEFPKTLIKDALTDLYGLLTHQDVADGISMTMRSMDEEKVKEMLDLVISQLKNDEVVLGIAKSVKNILSQVSTDDLQGQIEVLLSDAPMAQRMIFTAFFEMARPHIDEMRTLPVEDIAERLKDLADTIPSELVAQQLGAVTREFTPERVAKQLHDVVGKLPSPGAISDIVHGVGGHASKALNDVSKSTSGSDAADSLDKFAADAAKTVKQALNGDKTAKKNFGKGAKDFDL